MPLASPPTAPTATATPAAVCPPPPSTTDDWIHISLPSDRDDDRALDDLLQGGGDSHDAPLGEPYSFGATPRLDFAFPGQGGDGAGAGGGLGAKGEEEEEREEEAVQQVPTPREGRPGFLRRPSSLLSSRRSSSSSTSLVVLPTTTTAGAVSPAVDSQPSAFSRPFALPPGLSSSTPIPPSISSSSITARPTLTSSTSHSHPGSSSSLRPSALRRSSYPSTAAQASTSTSTFTPRAARISADPPLPLEIQWLLLTTPPPPKVGKAKRSAFAESAARQEQEAQAEARRMSQVAAEEKKERGKEGLVKRLWAMRLLNNPAFSSGRRASAPELSSAPPVPLAEPAMMRAPETLDLGLARRASLEGQNLRRSGRIDSRSAAEVVPKTWKDYEAMYAAGQLDIEDPPFPPLTSPTGATTTFPSRARPAVDLTKPSPYELAHFPAPLHLSPVTPIRERLIAQLDLLGERFAIASLPPPSQPPPTSALPPLPEPPAGEAPGSPVPSAPSSAASTAGRRDSLLQFSSSLGHGSTGTGARRDSVVSTAPSSALSHGSTGLGPGGKNRPLALNPSGGASVFPSRSLSASGSAGGLATAARGGPLSSSTGFGGAGMATSPLFSLRNHPALLSLLQRALYAPLGSHALFNPPPKAAVITLFPSSSDPSATAASQPSLVILAALNVPTQVPALPLSMALDAHVVLNGERGLVVMDTERDWRWRGNELVRDGPNVDQTGGGLGIRFFAGMPIFASSLPSLASYEEAAGGRIAIGTVSLLDDQPLLAPRKWGASERAKLRSLSSEITCEVERFLAERERAVEAVLGGRRGSEASEAASIPAPMAAPPMQPQPSTSSQQAKHLGHAKKVSFDRGSVATSGGGRRSSVGGNAYLDFDAQLAASNGTEQRNSLVAPKETDEDQPDPARKAHEEKQQLASTSLPPLLASTPPAVIFSSACTSLASSLSLSLVYLVALDLSACAPAPSLAGTPTLTLLAAHNMPTDSQASFDPALHLRALRAPEGGLLYRSSPPGKAAPQNEQQGGFASGVLLPVAETDVKGWVLAGYTTDRRRRWGEKEMDAFAKVSEGVAKVLLWQESGGWGKDGGEGERLPAIEA
ncbi:hypothetical protein JCM8097_006104 [Rhodosporidiobolus ruineniae]